MGLALEVGRLADLLVHDEEGAEWFREDLAKLNGVLAKAGLATHAEPRQCAVHSTAMLGYSGLHYLRRCAAHLQYRGVLPPPLGEGGQPTEDELLTQYGSEFVAENIETQPGVFAAPSTRRFDHLIMHSDAEGFYVPQSFDRVLIADDEAYGWIGSCQALQAECKLLADALELPGDILSDPESDVLFAAIDAGSRKGWSLFKPKAEPRAAWSDHPIAALSCAKLYCFAGYAIQSNAALVFC